jgi:trehalose utilization protein
MAEKIRVRIWNEGEHEKSNEKVAKLYPKGIHGAIADGLQSLGNFEITTATLDSEEQGCSEEVLNNTDVMLWWGHCAHAKVEDEYVKRVQKRVLEGMGLLVLHSGHFSKIFKALLGSTCGLRWRETIEGERERLWVVDPSHPIAAGVEDCIELPHTEMYGEPFGIPTPDELVFMSWFEGGEVFRSGATWKRGNGKIFYFRPGHETYPIYYEDIVLRVIANGIKWAAPVKVTMRDVGTFEHPKEKLDLQLPEWARKDS